MCLAPSLPIFLEAYLQLWEFKGFKICINVSLVKFLSAIIFKCESFVCYFYILSQKTTKVFELTLISFQPLWGSSCIWGWGDLHVYSLSEYLPISISFYFFFQFLAIFSVNALILLASSGNPILISILVSLIDPFILLWFLSQSLLQLVVITQRDSSSDSCVSECLTGLALAS